MKNKCNRFDGRIVSGMAISDQNVVENSICIERDRGSGGPRKPEYSVCGRTGQIHTRESGCEV